MEEVTISVFNINREKDKKRGQMYRQMCLANPGGTKIQMRKLWRKLEKEKELEQWTKNLLEQKVMDPANQKVMKAVQKMKMPDRGMVMEEIGKYIADCLENRELYLLEKVRENRCYPLNKERFEKLRQMASTLHNGGLERLCVRSSKKGKMVPISTTLQSEIDKACTRLFFKINTDLKPGAMFIDTKGVTHSVGKEIKDALRRNYMVPEIVTRIRRQYHFIYNLSMLSRNKRYSFAQIAYQEELRKDSLVMTAIPDNIIETYPYARNIRRHFILHIGGTNTGKTYEALQELKQAQTGIYLAPLRLLAFEVQEKLNDEGVPCTMRTGEEEAIVPGAKHESCTVEKLLCDAYYDLGVIDEAQMIADSSRGWAWTQAILGLYAKRIHICMSEDAENIVTDLIRRCGDSFEVVQHTRETELVYEKEPFVYPQDVKDHDALVVFSREKVIQTATELERMGIKTSMIYGALPSNVRKNEMLRFLSGETKVVVSTDAIGMGLNLPIRRIVFLESRKFDGEKKRFLVATEIKQIAGRAGRRGMFETGYVASTDSMEQMERKLFSSLRPIKKARVGFPQTLLSLDMSITDIMSRWTKIPDEGNLEKASLDKEIFLCSYMEQRYHFDKDTMMGFATIPFDVSRVVVYDYWRYLIQCYAQDNGDIDIPLPESAYGLEDMESLYRQYDLLYSFSKVIQNAYLQELVLRYKEILSDRIRNAVATKS